MGLDGLPQAAMPLDEPHAGERRLLFVRQLCAGCGAGRLFVCLVMFIPERRRQPCC